MDIKKSFSNQEHRRLSNIVWTITGKYGQRVDTHILSYEYLRYDILYSGIILGSTYNTLDYKMIKKLLEEIENSINKSEEIQTLLFMCLEQTAVTKNTKIENNIQKIRKINYLNQINTIESTTRKNRLNNVFRLAYMYKTLGKTMIFPPNIKKITNEIIDFENVGSTPEFVARFKSIIEKYFQFEIDSSKEEEKDTQDTTIQQVKSDRYVIARFFDNYVSKDYMPNETTADMNFRMNSHAVVSKENQHQEDMLKKIENYYGKMLYDKKRIEKIEKENCIGIHKGYKIFFTDGDISKTSDKYRLKVVMQEIEKNKEDYSSKFQIYEQNIKKLKNMLLRNMSDDVVINKSFTGKLEARLVYRAKYIGDEKIFRRKRYLQKNKIKVDIIVDGSASLNEKQHILSAQSYVVSRALQELDIENRVIAFNNFMEYSVIRILKDYHHTSSQRCFDYYCSGGNRDGLALSLIGSITEDEDNTNRIMIVFTDAKPYDVQVVNKIGKKNRLSYKDEVALRDTAESVRLIKKRNINIFGIYFGNKEDISDMKKIYSNDFVYVEDYLQFGNKVGEILVNFIK